ncbi:SusC/RagA family TonB-linked outer membrane protein [Flavobacterium johnsoniae]|jgi:TonB-linked SusC/RagA family outer membrane protein|uniref:SusC-like TonB-dependent receptor n=2 Tax=Flavobacterium johnsoniae TaxID=986 RepID=A5FNK1_FLAJ1|nr:TonB-dependent receptor [Flavobacterium johnsoniae]ABQ03222.1 SusC-like TonB-dependent receptor [Flavobacterium johnsoniae UW101]OXG01353.1 SusC/RagA family TonB-linked outer membrane protein [Flavobacterium johnsoniae UW101]WQG79914.1 TonB-dependent receptor [Flavobacterium johnsoniae UW101]SHL81668.1 TonB-linked outer membrane protein, SusC/RagA family [Flavobacterium johnsoniae]
MNFKDLLNKGANRCFAVVFLLCLLMSSRAMAQTVTLEGTVKDAAGLSLPGVNVLEKGTKNGTSTDFDGRYKIKLSNPKAILSFSFIGFKTKDVSAEGKTKVDIVLIEDSNNLNEVVVIGYGTAKKGDLTGAVSTISGNDLKKVPVANVAEALTGRIAGVQVTSAEGSPDADIRIRVRGGGSLTQDASPLIIVDGFPINSMNDISSSDIETMTVLKDAASTAIYGSRGANGVILITTKSGKDGKISVNFNMFYGMKTMANEIDVLSPEDYTKWQYEYAMLSQTGTKVPSDPTSYTKYFGNWQDHDMYNGLKGNDWQKQIFGRRGEVQSRDLGIRGGTDKLNYNFNYAHYDEKAIMLGSNYKRNNLALALKSKVSNKVDVGFTVRYSDTEIDGGGVNEQNEKSATDSRMRTIVGYAPIPVSGLTSDDVSGDGTDILVNPLRSIYDNNRQQFRKNFNMLGSFGWEIVDNLKFKVDLGLDNYNSLDYRFYGRSTYYVANTPASTLQGKPAMVITDGKERRFRNANTLNYDFKKIMGENHHLTALIGEESINYEVNTVTSTIHGYPSFFDFSQAKSLTSQGTPQAVDNYYNPDDRLLSFFGRANYDYKNRYILSATFRADGSSKFLPQNRWGYFPAFAAGWKISEESFLKGKSWIDLLKIRASYGEAGNNNIPVGQQTQIFQSIPTAWINGVTSVWAIPKTMPNPDLKWETTVTQNVGLDFGFFKNRLSGNFDVYKNVTSDLLINFPVPGSGYDYQYRNMGETQNTGFEATLNVVAIEKAKYGLNFSFNMGVNKNRINSLGVMSNFGAATNWASSQIGDDYLISVGSSLGTMYGYKNDGRYEVSDFDYVGGKYVLKSGVVATATTLVGDGSSLKPGDMKLKDVNGDGKVDLTDKTVIGNINPKSTGGFVINGNAYGFDLMAAFNWSIGNEVYNADKIEFSTANASGQYKNLNSTMADGKRWTNLDPVSGQLVTDPDALAALNANTTMWSPYMRTAIFTDWAVEDASFLRLNTLTLGYTAPEMFTSKLGVSKLRFYMTASNVFVWTKYSGSDPEVSTKRKNPLTPGVDSSPYPRSRQMVFGMNLNF